LSYERGLADLQRGGHADFGSELLANRTSRPGFVPSGRKRSGNRISQTLIGMVLLASRSAATALFKRCPLQGDSARQSAFCYCGAVVDYHICRHLEEPTDTPPFCSPETIRP
jgi:hypothetical protein